jgi:hypothetical protein
MLVLQAPVRLMQLFTDPVVDGLTFIISKILVPRLALTTGYAYRVMTGILLTITSNIFGKAAEQKVSGYTSALVRILSSPTMYKH